jgi:hypothetical protein
VQAVAQGAAAIDRSTIDRIVVYKGTSVDATVPNECLTASRGVADRCNVYYPSDFGRPESDFGCDTGEIDRNWCPSTRKVARSAANGGPPDYVGVWVRVRHAYVTGLFGSARTLTDELLMRIEPRVA